MGKEETIEWVRFPDDTFSDDSSFIGDAQIKASYEKRLATFNPRDFWDIHAWNQQCISTQENAAPSQPARQGVKRKREKSEEPVIKLEHRSKSAKMKQESMPAEAHTSPPASTASIASAASARPDESINPYADNPAAYQFHETVAEFIDRLRPSTTTLAETHFPWLWIANPASPAHRATMDIGGFKQSTLPLLDTFMQTRRDLEEQNPTKTPGSITRLLKPDRDHLESTIISIAQSKNVTSGKWMLFPYPPDVDAVWSKVCHSTLSGRLGSAAKVATDNGSAEKTQRLICVYTEDFSNQDDVKRVLAELRDLGLVKSDKAIYYKCDAYTYLDITSENEYKIKASTYNSRDMFKEMGRSKRR